MKVSYTKGNKHAKDHLIWMTPTDKEGNIREKEAISIFKLALLMNQLGINERVINKEKIKRYGNFLFVTALKAVLEQIERGVDWSDEGNIGLVKAWCRKCWIPFEKIETELRRVYQSKLEEFL